MDNSEWLDCDIAAVDVHTLRAGRGNTPTHRAESSDSPVKAFLPDSGSAANAKDTRLSQRHYFKHARQLLLLSRRSHNANEDEEVLLTVVYPCLPNHRAQEGQELSINWYRHESPGSQPH